MRQSEHVSRLTGFFRHPTPKAKCAFTLVELLVVVGIIGILVGIVMGVSGFANRRAAASRAMSDIERMKTALEEYRIERGRYFGPAWGAVTGLVVSGESFSNAMSKYVKDLNLVDPWGRSYLYSNSVLLSYRLWSDGPSTNTTADDIQTGIGNY